MNRSRQAINFSQPTQNLTSGMVQRWVVEREDEYARTWVDLDSHERRIEYLDPAEMSDRIADKLTMTLALAKALHVPVVEPGPVSITTPAAYSPANDRAVYLSIAALAASALSIVAHFAF